MEQGSTVFAGLDVHQDSIFVSAAVAGAEPQEWKLANDARAPQRLASRLRKLAAGAEVVACYEAGPCGYVLKRELDNRGIGCRVIAPSLIPVRPGERVKTDRRDARKLMRELRADGLTEVHPPTVAEEAVRDLCRCREDAKQDLKRAKQRLGKFLLRRGHVYRAGSLWTLSHWKWLRQLSFEHAADQVTFSEYLVTVKLREERVSEVTREIRAVASREPYREPVGWLCCLRGIDIVTAMTLVAEIHDFRRFRTARHLMSYLGLTPSEYSSGGRERRGAITKAGNSHVRRMLIEAAWHYRHLPYVGKALARRRREQPKEVIALADKAQRRLHRRFRRLAFDRNKAKCKVVTAVARELVGFIWAVLVETGGRRVQA